MKQGLPIIEEANNFFKEFEEASNKLRDIGAKAYTVPPSKNDINLYLALKDIISKIHIDKASNFEKIIKAAEPNIENLNDLVQKYTISNILIQYLYEIKSRKPEVDIMPIITLIPYWADNETWLKAVSEEAMPYLVNLDLI